MKKISLYKLRLGFAIIFFIISLIGIFGLYYGVNILDIQFIPLMQRNIVDFSVISFLLLVFIVFLTFVFGRVYCSTLCPLGILQELLLLLFVKKINNSYKKHNYKYIISLIIFSLLVGGSAFLVRYIDPYSIFFSALSFSFIGLLFLVAIIFLTIKYSRFFCINICPVGTLLGLISRFSLFKIKITDEACARCDICPSFCPSGSIDILNKQVNNETCLRCFKCIKTCSVAGIEYKIVKNNKTKTKFNINRRKLLIATGAIALFSSIALISSKVSKVVIECFKNVILPAGAKDSLNMSNKCLNCNLCIQNCPNGILEKGNTKIPFVHINFNNGKKYCSYECNKCSSVCPAGAIKRIKLEEKQKIKIARCSFNNNCIQCGACSFVCPTEAIKKTIDGVYINQEKCIGCAKCSSVCQFHGIDITSIDKQEII